MNQTDELHVPSRKTSGAISRIASAATQSRITSAATQSRITSAATHSRITSATRITSGTPSSRPLSTPEDRPQPYPSCYANLVFGRSSGQVSSASPGQAPPGTWIFRIIEKFRRRWYGSLNIKVMSV